MGASVVALTGAGTCPSCGADHQPDARFCPTCGHQLVERNDERRVATVVFADLARFTSLSETLDPEQVKNLMDRCFARMAGDVTRHGGRVDKVVGDAMVALFGAPVAHEDDAERAVRAALAMRASVADLSVQLDMGLALRVGINTGEVLVGAVHGGEYTAMGDVVNVASRLQAAADPGTVVVGPATHAATSAAVSYRPLGSVSMRNRDEPVEAWEALSTLAPPGRRPLKVSGPLVGRDNEMAILRHAFNLVAERQRPGLAVVLGDAGMGKSRLLADLGRWAEHTHGATVLEGRCAPYGQANPYWPLAEAVRQACGITASDQPDTVTIKLAAALEHHEAGTEDERAGLAAALRYLLGETAALADVDPQRAALEGRRAARMLLAAMTRTRPTLMILSEMHWADDQVLEPLGRMLDRLAGSAVLLVVTGRPELSDRWAPPHGRHDHLTLHLGPLDPAAAAALAQRLLGGDPTITSVTALVERSGGNPLFLEELAAYLSGGSAEELPVTLRGMVAARLDQLAPPERSLLEDAAVVGRSGTVASLAALAATRRAGDCETSLEELHAQELLQLGGDSWEFRSDVVREVVYETLTKSERARRHWALANWLDGGDGAARGDDERVAHHFACAAELAREVGAVAGVPDDAIRLAVAALDRAAAAAAGREAPLEAARLLDRALGLEPDRETRWHLLLDRAEARARMRTLEAAREDVDLVLAEAGPELRAPALTVLGTVLLHGGRWEDAAATLDDALVAWRERGDRRGEGQALRLAGMAAAEAGDPTRADALLSEALDIFQDVGDLRHEAWVMWHLAELAFAGGAVPLAEQRLAAADRLFLQAGDPGGSNWVQGLLGYVRLMQGRREEAADIADKLLGSARDRGDPWATGMILVLQGATRLWLGRPADAIAPLNEARATFASMDDDFGAWQAAGNLVRAFAATGDGEQARAAAVSAGLGLPPAPGTPPSPALALAVSLGEGARVADLVAAANLEGHRSKGANQPSGPEGGWGVSSETFIQMALAHLQAGQVDEGLAAVERALNLIGLSGEGAGITPSARAAEALARAAAGDTARAREAAGLVLSGDPPPTYLDACHALIARGLAAFRDGDAEGAANDLSAARRTAESTQDVLAAAVARLAWSVAGGGETDAARSALEAMGADPQGWETVFAAAVGQRV